MTTKDESKNINRGRFRIIIFLIKFAFIKFIINKTCFEHINFDRKKYSIENEDYTLHIILNLTLVAVIIEFKIILPKKLSYWLQNVKFKS